MSTTSEHGHDPSGIHRAAAAPPLLLPTTAQRRTIFVCDRRGSEGKESSRKRREVEVERGVLSANAPLADAYLDVEVGGGPQYVSFGRCKTLEKGFELSLPERDDEIRGKSSTNENVQDVVQFHVRSTVARTILPHCNDGRKFVEGLQKGLACWAKAAIDVACHPTPDDRTTQAKKGPIYPNDAGAMREQCGKMRIRVRDMRTTVHSEAEFKRLRTHAILAGNIGLLVRLQAADCKLRGDAEVTH
ncbi:hypothetical protein B0H13DRAFT_1851571 [Mycena leptocephala]|nr:hypothetical protein B0H13DRAFT_1851571 [Mycena leptocephala]